MNTAIKNLSESRAAMLIAELVVEASLSESNAGNRISALQAHFERSDSLGKDALTAVLIVRVALAGLNDAN